MLPANELRYRIRNNPVYEIRVSVVKSSLFDRVTRPERMTYQSPFQDATYQQVSTDDEGSHCRALLVVGATTDTAEQPVLIRSAERTLNAMSGGSTFVDGNIH